jgi:hypothetical protein
MTDQTVIFECGPFYKGPIFDYISIVVSYALELMCTNCAVTTQIHNCGNTCLNVSKTSLQRSNNRKYLEPKLVRAFAEGGRKNQTLRKLVVLLLLLRQIHHPVYFPHCACARRFIFSTKRRGGLPGSFCCISQHCETRSAVQPNRRYRGVIIQPLALRPHYLP